LTVTKIASKRIVIIDDHPIVREGLALMLGAEPGLEFAGEALGVEDGLRLIEHERPDAALIDLTLGASSGLELIRMVCDSHPETRILVISMHDETLYAERCMRAGAHGYVSKSEASRTLVAALRTVLAGETYLSPKMSQHILSRRVGRSSRAPEEQLSDRELEVFRLIGSGLKTGQIAERLGLSAKTIETYRARLKSKLGIKTAAELALRAAHHTLTDG